jgi:hypothetical protein
MKTQNSLFPLVGALSVVLSAAAQDQKPLPVLDALPSAESLGSNWRREIGLLFDSASNPAQIVGSTTLPDSWKKAKREAVDNPTNRVSGWSHAYFDYQSTNATNRYVVQVERYRNKQRVIEDFNHLLTFNATDYQKKDIKGIGEAAVVYCNASGMTLWFRTGTFRVWISPISPTRSWEKDTALRELAKAMEKRMEAKLSDKKTPIRRTGE